MRPTLVLDDHADRPPVEAGPPAAPESVEQEPVSQPLPVWHLLAVAGTGTFAVWTSLTCFVC